MGLLVYGFGSSLCMTGGYSVFSWCHLVMSVSLSVSMFAWSHASSMYMCSCICAAVVIGSGCCKKTVMLSMYKRM